MKIKLSFLVIVYFSSSMFICSQEDENIINTFLHNSSQRLFDVKSTAIPLIFHFNFFHERLKDDFFTFGVEKH
jgi:hypothetical protein